MLTKQEYVKIAIFLITICFIITIQVLIAGYLASLSIPIISYLQSNKPLVIFMQFLTLLGSRRIKTLLLCITFSFCSHYHTFLFALITYFSMFFNGLLKINLQQPRPFFLSDEIEALSCEFGYGYPSNHVITTVPAFLIFFEIMYYRFEFDKRRKSGAYYWFGITAVFLLCVLIGISRLVLGVHSLDQVVFGLIMGFAVYYFFFDVIDMNIKNPLPFIRILFNNYYFYKVILIMSLLFFGFFINAILLDGNDYYDTIWTVRIIEGCGYYPYLTPFFKCLIDVCDFMVIVGVLIGMIIDIKVTTRYQNVEDFIYDNVSHDNHSRVGQWNHTTILPLLLRVVLTYLQTNVIAWICKLGIGLFDKSLIVEMFFDKIIPLTLVGILMFVLYRKEFEYLGITNKIVHNNKAN
jgi:membrane-associated phospholipid phosphatase